MKWKRQRKKAKETKTWILSDQHNSRPHLLQVDHGEKKSQTSAWYKKDINNKQNPIRLRNEDVIFPNKISIHQPDNIIQLYVIAKWNLPQDDSLDTHQDISPPHYRKAKSISKSNKTKQTPDHFNVFQVKRLESVNLCRHEEWERD